jgi:hypothetical protein
MYHTKTPIQRSMKIVPPDNQNFQGLELVPPNSIQVLIKKPGTGVSEGSGEGKLIRRQTTGTLLEEMSADSQLQHLEAFKTEQENDYVTCPKTN